MNASVFKQKMRQYYVDTCIWIDFYENRSDKFRPLGDWALMFFKKVEQEEEIIFVSDVVVRELSRFYSPEKIREIFDVFENKYLLQFLTKTRIQVAEAVKMNRLKQIGFSDILHAIIARDAGAILITRDAHFLAQDIVTVKKPEDLL